MRKAISILSIVLSFMMIFTMVVPSATVTAYADELNGQVKAENATTKLITVKYKTSTGIDKGSENIKVVKGTTEIPVTALTKIPTGYKVVGSIKVNGRFATAVVEPENLTPDKPETQKRDVVVSFKTADGTVVTTQTLSVSYDKTSLSKDELTIPEGYEAVNNSVALAGTANAVDFLVQKVQGETNKMTEIVGFVFKTETGEEIGTSVSGSRVMVKI